MKALTHLIFFPDAVLYILLSMRFNACFPNSKKIIWVHQEAKSLQRINFQSGRNIFCSYLLLLVSSWLRIHRFVWTLNSYKFIKKVFSWLPTIFLKKSRCVYSFLVVGNSSVLAWRIPGTGEPGGLPSTGSHRVGHDWSDLAAVCIIKASEQLAHISLYTVAIVTWTHDNYQNNHI